MRFLWITSEFRGFFEMAEWRGLTAATIVGAAGQLVAASLRGGGRGECAAVTVRVWDGEGQWAGG